MNELRPTVPTRMSPSSGVGVISTSTISPSTPVTFPISEASLPEQYFAPSQSAEDTKMLRPSPLPEESRKRRKDKIRLYKTGLSFIERPKVGKAMVICGAFFLLQRYRYKVGRLVKNLSNLYIFASSPTKTAAIPTRSVPCGPRYLRTNKGQRGLEASLKGVPGP